MRCGNFGLRKFVLTVVPIGDWLRDLATVADSVSWFLRLDLGLDIHSAESYSPIYLVFGKTVQIRHYPVTVNAKN